MAKWLFIFIAVIVVSFLFIYPQTMKKHSFLLILNSVDKNSLPRNFHTTPFNSSGSAQFSNGELQLMIKEIPSSTVTIVDLRQEPHGFLNGSAISWYHQHNWGYIGKNVQEIKQQERSLVEKLGKKWLTLVYHNRRLPVPYLVKATNTEQSLVQQQKLRYYRLPVTDHMRPADSTVDQFVHWVKNQPQDVWLHFHCSAGKGRTTTFLTMQDCMLNAAKDSLDTIISRQHKLGGIHLYRISESKEKLWKKKQLEARIHFIRHFYEYCRENPNFNLTWTEWIEKKGITPYNPGHE